MLTGFDLEAREWTHDKNLQQELDRLARELESP